MSRRVEEPRWADYENRFERRGEIRLFGVGVSGDKMRYAGVDVFGALSAVGFGEAPNVLLRGRGADGENAGKNYVHVFEHCATKFWEDLPCVGEGVVDMCV